MFTPSLAPRNQTSEQTTVVFTAVIIVTLFFDHTNPPLKRTTHTQKKTN